MSIGRRARSIPPGIRRALLLRDHGCAFPGCTHTTFLHGHHIRHWLHGGETSMENLVMLCTFHHHLVHEGGWTVSAIAGGGFAFRSPSGEPLAPQPAWRLIADPLGWLRGWMERNGLEVGPETTLSAWDGKHPDYANAVECLLEGGR